MSEFMPFKMHNLPVAGGQARTVSKYYEDMRFPATTVRTNPASEFPAFDTTIPGRLFRHTATDSVYLIAQIPHAWREGTTLLPHVHWQKTTSAAGGVYWQLSYRWASIGQALEDAVVIGSATPSVSDGNTANVHALTRLGNIPAAEKHISDMLLMTLSRVHDNAADNYGASARLIEFDIHYQVNSPGSRQEFIK
jgi:hypothetical protein